MNHRCNLYNCTSMSWYCCICCGWCMAVLIGTRCWLLAASRREDYYLFKLCFVRRKLVSYLSEWWKKAILPWTVRKLVPHGMRRSKFAWIQPQSKKQIKGPNKHVYVSEKERSKSSINKSIQCYQWNPLKSAISHRMNESYQRSRSPGIRNKSKVAVHFKSNRQRRDQVSLFENPIGDH